MNPVIFFYIILFILSVFSNDKELMVVQPHIFYHVLGLKMERETSWHHLIEVILIFLGNLWVYIS